MQTLLIWVGFLLFIGSMVALDLGVFHRKAHTVSFKEAITWTCVWITTALIFNFVVYYLYSSGLLEGVDLNGRPLTAKNAALQFLTGYVLEYSLSVDNIFVIAVIIAAFRVPPSEQHRVLFWGVLGAVVFRGIMIAGGAVLIERFHWIMYVFGALLLVSALKMWTSDEGEVDVEKSLLVRLARRIYPVTTEYHGSRFFVDINGKRHITPLFLTIALVEATDVMFALDSIPAIFGMTREPFLVFTSNIFAILGLRSLYFALAGMMDKFRYLKSSLVFLLAFIGVKMLLEASHVFHIPTGVSLSIVGTILALGVLASLVASRREMLRAGAPRKAVSEAGAGATSEVDRSDA
ncbi:MAG: TerC family protein [Planctomyces sp.]|nr:TerC family protein [Planctomyces sp.]